MQQLKKKENMFIFGIFSLLIAISLGRYVGNFTLIDFLEGMFTGFSLVMMLGFLAKFGKERKLSGKITQN